ncbi:TRAP-type C4-dicarboxylate transport system substrate-binding protein [Rhodoligotrophos appendicifer]|uniref:TRAP transporter substrate-binding protein n=1 Tax=Rhodoligotrophos appendicifer TaxID=987056 RepID=UPI0011852112|nr:TRAP transporter substrate-binding protein DctP [Rhodoligotrophos appendicifer]
MKTMKKLGVAMAAMVAVASSALSASAETTLRVADYLPLTHYLTVVGLAPLMEAVTKDTNGEVKFQHFPAQQLGKSTDFLRLVNSNVAQIAVVGVSFLGDKMELSNVAQMPGAFDKACNGLVAYDKLAEGGALGERDFTANGVTLLYPIVLPPFELVTSNTPINTVDDMKGKKIMVATRATESLMNKIGAAPMMTGSGAAAYEAVTRGTIDGLIFAPDSILTYKLDTVTKYGTQNANLGGQVVAVIMNTKAFEALDPKAQEAIKAESKKAAQRVCEYVDRKKSEAITKILANGVDLKKFSDADLEKLDGYAQAVQTDWAKELDSRNLPGTETLKAFKAALPAN